MKKYLFIIIILAIVVVSFVAVILNKIPKEENQVNKTYDEEKIKEIDNSINMTQVRYESIDNIIYFERDMELSDEDYLILRNCSKAIQASLEKKELLYKRTMKENKEEKTKTYRFSQMAYMMEIDGAQLNIDCTKSGAIDNIIGVTNKEHGGMITAWANPKDGSCKLTLVEAKDILVKYFYDNENDYNIVKQGNKVNCRGRLYYYDSKVCQKIEFSVGNSYIIIDANTGEVLNKYFHNGIFID